MAAKNILYLGSTPLIDLSDYVTSVDTSVFATQSWVQQEISNVDVTDQLANYVEKEEGMGLSQNSFTDSLKSKLEGLSNYDDTSISAALALVTSTLQDITTDSSTVTTVIDTWAEIKQFLSDYDTEDKLKSIIDATTTEIEQYVSEQGYLTSNDTSVYALKSEIPVIPTNISSFNNDEGYLKSNDVSNLVSQNDASVYALKSEIPVIPTNISSFNNDAGYIKQNDVSTFVTRNDASVYLKANDVSTFITQNDASVYASKNDISTFLTSNDVSTKVTSASVLNIVTLSQADFNTLPSKDSSTLYIIVDNTAPAAQAKPAAPVIDIVSGYDYNPMLNPAPNATEEERENYETPDWVLESGYNESGEGLWIIIENSTPDTSVYYTWLDASVPNFTTPGNNGQYERYEYTHPIWMSSTTYGGGMYDDIFYTGCCAYVETHDGIKSDVTTYIGGNYGEPTPDTYWQEPEPDPEPEPEPEPEP